MTNATRSPPVPVSVPPCDNPAAPQHIAPQAGQRAEPAGNPLPPHEARAAARAITCLASGTMVVTTRGEMPVETLRAGELMLTMHGAPARRPLLHVARSRFELTRAAEPSRLAPILIKAGALMRGAPIRDMRVSPGQGIYLDDQLVPARLLVNGTTIRQDVSIDAVTYHYLWLDGHDLLIADGALTESSFVDESERDFGGAANVAAFTADVTGRMCGRMPRTRCAPLLLEGPELVAIQRRIALHAGAATAS